VLQKRNIAVGACHYGMPTKFVCGVVSSFAAQAMTVLQLRAAMLQPAAVRIQQSTCHLVKLSCTSLMSQQYSPTVVSGRYYVTVVPDLGFSVLELKIYTFPESAFHKQRFVALVLLPRRLAASMTQVR